MVEVSLLGPAALNAAMSSGLLDRLLSEVTTGDGLTQLTALQLLTPLAMSPGGRALLDEKGVTARLMYLLSMAQSDPVARMLTHGGWVCLFPSSNIHQIMLTCLAYISFSFVSTSWIFSPLNISQLDYSRYA